MTDSIVWGPEIQVNGKRPGWIRNDEWRHVRTLACGEWQTADVESPGDSIEDMDEWAWDTIEAIRLPADYPHYSKEPTTPERDPALWDRMVALVRSMANRYDSGRSDDESVARDAYPWMRDARAIVADLPKPVDPDTQAAKAIVAEEWPNAAPENEHALVRAAWLGIRFSRRGDAA